ncbi:MAG: pyridoxamine 5'-phosphate oxidase family protein [Frankia sp.]|nr:pyridoxamine 5'-phosphate oxidase family protein [Frankia sp.]
MLQPTRKRDRVAVERAAADAVLDEALVCQVGIVVDGRPHVLPTLHARVGDLLCAHSSVAARIAAAAHPSPLPVCVTVSVLDGLVYARSWFNHSVNYRSVVIHGDAHLITDPDEKTRLLAAFVNRFGAGRADASRPPTAKELAATAVLAVDLAADSTDIAVKRRAGGPVDDPADLDIGYWAGVVPVRVTAGPPESAVDLPVPANLAPTFG